MRVSTLLAALASCAVGVLATDDSDDLFNVNTPFRLVTTQSTTVPVVPTGYIYYDYTNSSSGLLTLFTNLETVSGTGSTFLLTWGSLGTATPPSTDSLKTTHLFNSTTPPSDQSPTFSDQAVDHAGYDINKGFLSIHGIPYPRVWYLCPSTVGGRKIYHIIYDALRSGCTPTNIAIVQ